MTKRLTAEMDRCLLIVRKFGCIVRYPGGYWQKPNDKSGFTPDDSVSGGTITALINRDLLSPAQFKNGPRGRFAVTAVFTKRGDKYVPPVGDGYTMKQLEMFED